jgi:AcrR family transcriptional regulator
VTILTSKESYPNLSFRVNFHTVQLDHRAAPRGAASPCGLRERKKIATRAGLAEAALRLAVERGLEHVTIDDIAAAVEVSPRTFFNYFSSKEEAIVANTLHHGELLGAALCACPEAEPVWESLRRTAVTLVREADAEDRPWFATVRLIRSHRSLLAQQLAADATCEHMIAAEVARRTGTDADRDLYPRLVAGSVLTALRVSVDAWLADPGPGRLCEVVDHALADVAAGLPEPSTPARVTPEEPAR